MLNSTFSSQIVREQIYKMNLLICLCMCVGLSLAAPLEDPIQPDEQLLPGSGDAPNKPVIMVDPTPPTGLYPTTVIEPADSSIEVDPSTHEKEPVIMIDPTAPPGFVPTTVVEPESLGDEQLPSFDLELFLLYSGYADLDGPK